LHTCILAYYIIFIYISIGFATFLGCSEDDPEPFVREAAAAALHAAAEGAEKTSISEAKKQQIVG
jgi:hypothetical protein